MDSDYALGGAQGPAGFLLLRVTGTTPARAIWEELQQCVEDVVAGDKPQNQLLCLLREKNNTDKEREPRGGRMMRVIPASYLQTQKAEQLAIFKERKILKSHLK